MGRKLPGGTYLVPHRLMPITKEYDSSGTVLQTFRLDKKELGGKAAPNGNFAAHRFEDGSTRITCASGNRMVIFDENGEVIWHLTNKDTGGLLNDVCGLHVLKSGNFLVSCYGNQKPDQFRLIEFTRDKKIVWAYQNNSARYVHNIQVLSTNGVKE